MVVGCAFAISILPALLPAAYFRPRSWERHVYPWLGLSLFRTLAPDGRWVSKRLRRIEPTYRVTRNAETRARHLTGSVTNERWHLSWLIFGVFTQVAALLRGQFVWAAVLCAFNVIFNLYPVLHQRHVRARARRSRTRPPQ